LSNHKTSKEKIYFFETQDVTLEDFQHEGWILDIGGGGEGIISRLKGHNVIAIDPSRRELEEAPPGPLKIVMDARELQFLDEAFATVTSFFTMMYIAGSDHAKVFQEVFRVLENGGQFQIWDGVLPVQLDDDKEIAAFMLRVTLPGEVVEIGYGTKWPAKEQNLEYYVSIAKATGFDILETREDGRMLYMKLRKPNK
jgi:ubiquinone/menaquinone biosynthesis C-methylase UbiE